MTGTTLQLINGLVLLFTFFSCRILWGTYQSVQVFRDVWRAYAAGPYVPVDLQSSKFANATTIAGGGENGVFPSDVLQFAEGQTVPLWLAGAYLASNLVLNSLNWFWFGKMIETLRKRFDPPLGTKRPEAKVVEDVPEEEKVSVQGIHVSTPAALGDDAGDYLNVETEKKKGGQHLEVSQSEVRSRTTTRRRG